jgi:hypothetical protein
MTARRIVQTLIVGASIALATLVATSGTGYTQSSEVARREEPPD